MKLDQQSASEKTFNKVVRISAPPSRVWRILTTPELMKMWMMPDIEIEIITDWNVGEPITIRGNMNGKNFENRGIVLKFNPEEALQYSHLSSLSRLPDRLESYSILDFRLSPTEEQTILELTLHNFPTESIHKHLAFYWNVTLETLKKMIEEKDINSGEYKLWK
jgi:uncharacterized protein YndB with AHSA1/START domain